MSSVARIIGTPCNTLSMAPIGGRARIGFISSQNPRGLLPIQVKTINSYRRILFSKSKTDDSSTKFLTSLADAPLIPRLAHDLGKPLLLLNGYSERLRDLSIQAGIRRSDGLIRGLNNVKSRCMAVSKGFEHVMMLPQKKQPADHVFLARVQKQLHELARLAKKQRDILNSNRAELGRKIGDAGISETAFFRMVDQFSRATELVRLYVKEVEEILKVGKEVVRPTHFLLSEFIRNRVLFELRGAAEVGEKGGWEEVSKWIDNRVNPNIEVFADQMLLARAILNLLRNAIKYTPHENENKKITIRANFTNGSLFIRVSDHGIGISRKALESGAIFNPFVSLKDQFGRSQATELPSGGQGLAIVKIVAEKHGGSVGVKSRVGRGTTFIFELPKNPKSSKRKN